MNDVITGGAGPSAVRFDPGDGVAIVGGGSVCLLLDDPHSELVVGLREAMADQGASDAALDVMVRTSGLDLPPFGLVTIDGTRARVVVRGRVGASVHTIDDEIEVLGDKVRSWVERVIDDVTSVTVALDVSGLEPGRAPAFDAPSGLLPASRVQLIVDTDVPGDVAVHADPIGHVVVDPAAVDADAVDADAVDPVVIDGTDAVDRPDGESSDGAGLRDEGDQGPGGWGMADAVEAAEHAGSVRPLDEADPAEDLLEDESMEVGSSQLDPTVFGAAGSGEVALVVAASELGESNQPVQPVVAEEWSGPPSGSGWYAGEGVEPAPTSGLPDQSSALAIDLPVPPSMTAMTDETSAHSGLGAAEPPVIDHNATLVGPLEHLVEEPPQEQAPAWGDAPELVTTPPPFEQPFALSIDPPAKTTDPVVSEVVDDDYDHLFGATQYRTVEQAAVRPDEDPDEVLGSTHSEPMISGIPAVGSASGPSTDPLPDPAAGDHDGHTVSLASLRSQLAQSAPSPGATPSVHAVHCPAGHLNPTHAGTCRACGEVIFDQEHVSVPRPVLGRIVFADGRIVTVDRPLLIGRAPKLEGVLSGEPPEMVVVASPLKEVSSTHLEIRLEGWQVLVVDRQSTNGTVITPPGRDPQRLRPAEPVPIVPGTGVNLADEVMFTFEVEV